MRQKHTDRVNFCSSVAAAVDSSQVSAETTICATLRSVIEDITCNIFAVVITTGLWTGTFTLPTLKHAWRHLREKGLHPPLT
ncbi:uncharacterized protein BDV14DRAFT_23609 [Aspergillus stella-maris]|uniref:uncharacterized protein n=1 Tax=Aspergillus stella-maris TaxID=1810926 RepID=UPI003CCD3F59